MDYNDYNNKYPLYEGNNPLKKTLKEKLIAGGEKFKYLLQKTSIEVALLAVLGMSAGIGYQRGEEIKRTKKIPLAFSEIGAIERKATKTGTEVGPITLYELKLNDMCMKIFEAYNEAQSHFTAKTNYEKFASNIYDAMDLRNIYKYNLKDLVQQVPTYIPQVNKKLEKYSTISKNLDITNQYLNNAWDESHTDNYHTEIETKIVEDADGNLTTETETVQVYDNTTHDYEYNKENGESAAKNLTTLFQKVPTIKLEEKILKTDETNAEGEYAAEKSREKSAAKDKLTQQELLDIANTRYTGSTILKDIRTVNELYPKLHTSATDWNKAKASAHDETYTTTSHSDAGPQEFQIAENTLDLGIEINNSLKEMQEVITTTSIKVPLLEDKINKFIEVGYVKYSSSEKEAKQLGEEILTLTKEIYKLNFKEGINVDRFRWGMIFLFALIGGAIGAGAGAGLDYLDKKKNIYDKVKIRKK